MTRPIRRIRRQFVLVLVASGPFVQAAEPAFGDLPPGALGKSVVSDVDAEICRDHLFDPSRAPARLPEGYRFIPASELAREEPGVAGLVKGKEAHRAYAAGSLCFMSVGSFVVDGVRVRSSGRTPMAYWWVRATGPRDERMRGKVEWLQLASWYPRDIASRGPIVASDPMARFVDLDVTQSEPGVWRLRMVLADEVVEATVRASGPRRKRNAPQPGFMSVPFTGDSADRFWVITYFGHHHRSAAGEWRVRGSGVFNDALGIPGEAEVFKTHFQDGWSALSGVYRFGR